MAKKKQIRHNLFLCILWVNILISLRVLILWQLLIYSLLLEALCMVRLVRQCLCIKKANNFKALKLYQKYKNKSKKLPKFSIFHSRKLNISSTQIRNEKNV